MSKKNKLKIKKPNIDFNKWYNPTIMILMSIFGVMIGIIFASLLLIFK